MKIEIRNSFTKDAEKLPVKFQNKLAGIIEALEIVHHPNEINNCKKLIGHRTAYRIRLAQYRIAFSYENKTIELVRILHRKEIYRYFP